MELAPFSAVDRSALRWLQFAEEPAEFRLLSGETPVETLSWKRRGGSFATGTHREGAWTFKRTGFLSPSIEVREQGNDRPVARLLAHLRHHEIRLPGGLSFTLVHASRLQPSWNLLTATGQEVLHIEPVAERGSLRGGAVVVSGQRDPAEVLLLVTLCWYFVVLSWFEDELLEAFTALEGWEPPRGERPAPSSAPPSGGGAGPSAT
jgi:hypothetical protein